MLSPQISPLPWGCLPTAFAIALGEPVADILSLIGHDGSQIPKAFKDLPEPFCRRAFHIQELLDVCLDKGYGVIPIEALPHSSPKHHYGFLPWGSQQAEIRFLKHVMGRQGVITGVAENGMPHAIAWDCSIGLDPKNGQHIRLSEFCPQVFFWIPRIAQSNPS